MRVSTVIRVRSMTQEGLGDVIVVNSVLWKSYSDIAIAIQGKHYRNIRICSTSEKSCLFIAVIMEAVLHGYSVIQTKSYFERYQLLNAITASRHGADRLIILLPFVVCHYILAL